MGRPLPSVAFVPFEPLLAQAPLLVLTEGPSGFANAQPGQISTLARMTGVSRATVGRWKRAGRLDVYSADRAAVALGLVPAMIWPEWYDLPQDEAS